MANSTLENSLWDQAVGLRAIFYLLPPSEHEDDVEKVPDYIGKAIPWFYAMILLDWVVGWWRNKLSFESRDAIGSLTAGSMSQMTKLLGEGGLEMAIYTALYNYGHFLDLENRSWTFWLIGFFGYDFGYYLTHRFGHEINFLWAAHQVHHSSEYYNMATALRQSALHNHHRVHHGRNPYCIDKNYAAVLIIWDRMLGTFAAEREEEPVVYGLVSPIETYDPIKIQCKYYNELFWYCLSGKNSFSQKMQKLWYGPGWNIEEQKYYPIPEVAKDSKPWNSQIDTPMLLYVIAQYSITNILFVTALEYVSYCNAAYITLSFWIYGNLMNPKEDRMSHIFFEFCRLVLGLVYFSTRINETLFAAMFRWNLVSCFLLTLYCVLCPGPEFKKKLE
ncbi:Oidioi.mRNA.OKI2018_I69.chr1.g3903.t1.cds [Oikopleura dioica]|uniref:Transmembrane protein 195 n=1 Tax=Oikopleura dioica TaxID=34765 RepID=A0ABN7SZW8_OIKDI|nr:Oidioi.mRNA.OKI2018_I69.chr1.g3903.t1.cds [Oikopleura dioica]